MKTLKLKLGWVAKNIGPVKSGAEIESLGRRHLAGISTDSRTIKDGEVFVALAGENFDGHSHVVEAFKKGALAAVTQKTIRGGGVAGRVLRVPDTFQALGNLAGALLRQQKIKVLGLTGSNGKTTTKEMIASILSLDDSHLLATAGNFNNLVGLPLTVFRLEKETRQAVLEMGMNHFREIEKLTEIADPDVGLITSVGAAHLEFFDSVSQVAAAKGELFAGLKSSAVAVVNVDDPLIINEAKRFSGNKLTFGCNAGAHVRLDRIQSHSLAGQDLLIYGPGAENGQKIHLNLLGSHNARNALAAAAASLAFGADWDQITEGLGRVQSYPGRLRVIKIARGQCILDDSYNANPTSMSAGLRTLGEIAGKKPKGALLGDMLELGPKTALWHRDVGRLAAELNLDFLALVGEQSAVTARAARRAGLPAARVAEFSTPEEAALWIRQTRPKNSLVLVKGSHGVHLERAVKVLAD